MPTFLQSIADRWQASTELTALMPLARVFTGRIPTTEEYRMPYVSIAQGASRSLYRTDKTQSYAVSIAFHIWVDDADIATAERIEAALTAAYAEGGWSYDTGFGQGQVLDIVDQGPAVKNQINRPTYKAWQAIKNLTFIIERERVDTVAGDDASSFAEESTT
jgi:hypothetical protein